MGQRGPAPKPTALKVLQGTDRPDRRAKKEPKPRRGADCPAWLDKEAKAEWHRIAPELHRLGLLTVVDRSSLAAYCDAYSKWRKLVAAINRKRSMFMKVGKSGYRQEIPEVSLAKKYRDDMLKFAREFGFTPAARSRVESSPLVSGDGEEDSGEAFLFS